MICEIMPPDSIPFSPKFRRYPAQISHQLNKIHEALGVVRSARVLPPAVTDQLRSTALAGTVHFSNLIEGNQLPFIEAERAARKELDPTTRAKIELINYVAAVEFVDKALADDRFELTPQFLLDIHREVTRGLGREDDPHFKPHHEGAWRDGIAAVVDHITGQIMHLGASAEEVPGRMAGLFEYLDGRWGKAEWPPFVLAGVAHFAVADIHPFADGNGRTARLLQGALLMRADAVPGRIFSFERYYAQDKNSYLAALRSVGKKTGNMEDWLEYFLAGLLEEYERIEAIVADLDRLSGATSQLQLTQSQQAAISSFRINRVRSFTRRDYEEAAKVKRTVALEDLQALVRSGLVETNGSGPATTYRLSSSIRGHGDFGRGRPVTWTDDRIEQELRGILIRYDGWPSRDEFKRAGKADLYRAASRRGGIRHWRRELGV